MSAAKRLFVALDFPRGMKETLGKLEEPVPGLKWVIPDNIHLTLRFIGAADSPAQKRLESGLAGVRIPSLSLPRVRLRGLASRGRGKGAMLWANVETDATLASLRDEVEKAAVAAGFAAETRPFLPHVTLARSRGAEAGGAGAIAEKHAGLALEFEAREFTLFASELNPQGPIYTPEAVYEILPQGNLP